MSTAWSTEISIKHREFYISDVKFFYLYIYPPDSQKSGGGANTWGRLLPRPASKDIAVLLKFNRGKIEI